MFFSTPKEIRYMQYLAASSATLSITSSALYATWSSPTLPKLTSSDSPIGITLTKEEASWVASTVLLGGIVGGIFSGWLLSIVGPKTTLLISVLPMFFPWLAIIFAKSALTLCIARFIAGAGACISLTAVPIYIGEISDKDIRGRLGATLNMLKHSGSLVALTIGPFVSYTTLAVLSSIFPLLFGIIFCFMPESPYYLLKTHQRDAAYSTITRLRGKHSDKKMIQSQLHEIDKTLEHDMANSSTLLELFMNPEYRQQLIIMTGIKLLQNFNGSNAVEAYMQSIIQTSDSHISPEHSSLIFGVIQVPAVLVTAVIVDKVGRKPLLIISALSCALALSAEGFYFYLQDHVKQLETIDSLSWIPTTALVLFLIMKPIGIGTLPYVLLGEIFPTNIKSQAVSLFSTLGCLFGFIVVKFFEPISTIWGMYTMFWFFTAACIFGAIFVVIVVPETKGKTFMEIQETFKKPPG